jgi:hypothetical protein
MKKILLFAAAAAMVFTSCMKEEGQTIPAGQSRISVKLANVVKKTRNIDTPAGSGAEAEFSNDSRVYVYVLTAEGGKEHGEAITKDEAVAGKLLNEGQPFSNTCKVFVLANIPADITDAMLSGANNLTEIKALSSTIVYDNTLTTNIKDNVTFATPTLANVNGEPTELEEADPTGLAMANVMVAPTFARIEFKEVRGGASIPPTAGTFKIDGLFLDKYYSEYTIGGGIATGATYYNRGNVPFDGDAPAGWFCEIPEYPLSSTTSKSITAGSGNVWAFHAAANSTPPTFVVRFSAMRFYEIMTENPDVYDTVSTPTPVPTTELPKYLSITGYAGNEPFKAGHIYKVSVIEFDYKQVADTPNPDAVNIQVKVDIEPWVVVDLTPVIGDVE